MSKNGSAPGDAQPHPGRDSGKNKGSGQAAHGGRGRPFWTHRYAAIDLGTNNCRLLIASPGRSRLRIVDAFSRIVRLGEGVAGTGRLSDSAIERTLEALKICAGKIARRNADVVRCIATQACRGAENAPAFLERVESETGLTFDVIDTEEEANLAVRGCSQLIDPKADAVLVFDIGGGSTELSWVDLREADRRKLGQFPPPRPHVAGWTSLPFGVVNLSENFGGGTMTRAEYDQMVEEVRARLRAFDGAQDLKTAFEAGDAHILGTSGTVTSIAGVYLSLARYERARVDGLWLSADDARAVSERLRAMSHEERAAQPCIGAERADLVVSGCAVLEAVLAEWPATRLRVADRGLREGVIYELVDGKRRAAKKRRRRN